MRIVITILCLSILHFSCINNDTRIAAAKDSLKAEDTLEDDWIPAMKILSDTSEIQILEYTDTLYKGDVLQLRFRVPHHTDFCIVSPSGEFYFIVYKGGDSIKHPLISPEHFATLEKLDIVTNKTKASRGNMEAKENELIFTETGEYEIRLSENLATDDGTPVEIKSVYYIDHPRKR